MEVHDQIAVKRLVLTDDAGTPVAFLIGKDFGFVGLQTVSGPEESSVSIGITEDGHAQVLVQRAGGSAMVSVTDSGKAFVGLKDADGTNRTLIAGGDSLITEGD